MPELKSSTNGQKRETIVALLTARGGSKLSNKNLLSVLGKPLLTYPAEAAKRSKYIQNFFASSDDLEILKTAETCGYLGILRPPEISGPQAQHRDCIVHALRVMDVEHNVRPDVLIVILGNSASICAAWSDACIDLLISDPKASAAVPVAEDMDHHPFRAKRVDKSGYLDSFIRFPAGPVSTNRQDLEACYFLCHNFWVLRVQASVNNRSGKKPWTFMGRRVVPFRVSNSVDVHSLFDLELTERWLQENRGLWV